jgi:hypothetical protein
MNEEGSIIGIFLEALPAQTLVSKGGTMRLSTGTPVVVEIRMAPVVEFQHHRAKDFPLQRESVHAGCLSCPPSVVSRQQEREET